MKYFLVIITFCFASIVSAQKTSLDSYKKYFDKELRSWTGSFTNFKLSEFKRSDRLSFEINEKQDFKNLKSFLSVYKPIIT